MCVIGYIIEKQYGDTKKWTKVVTLDPGNLQFCVENLKEKSDLYFRIYAENSVGLSTPAGTSVISLKTHASKCHTVVTSNYNLYYYLFIIFRKTLHNILIGVLVV